MKKILTTILAAALGATAWGADETPLVTVDVNGTITNYNSSDYYLETSVYNADGRCLDYVFANVAKGKTAADTVTITLNRDTTPDMNGFVVLGNVTMYGSYLAGGNAEDMPNVILDLNGHTISASVTAHDSDAQTVIETMYARLTIRDSSVEKTGTITSTDAIFTVKAGAASYVTLESGNLLSTCVNGSLHGVGIVIQGDNPEGHILLEGGTFSGNSGTQWSSYVAEGKEVVDNGDNTFTVRSAVQPVAKIGETEYETLVEAFAAAKDGETVTMLENTTGKFSVDKNITLDLNGKTILAEGSRSITIDVKANVIIKDTSANGNGTVSNTGYVGKGINVANGCRLEVQSGVISGSYGVYVNQRALAMLSGTAKVSGDSYGVWIAGSYSDPSQYGALNVSGSAQVESRGLEGIGIRAQNASHITIESGASVYGTVEGIRCGLTKLVVAENTVSSGPGGVGIYYQAMNGTWYSEYLYNLIKVVEDGDEVRLVAGSESVSGFTVDNAKAFTIDLGGRDIGYLNLKSGFVTLTGSGTISGTVKVYGSSDTSLGVGDYNKLDIGSGISLTASTSILFHNHNYSADGVGYGSEVNVYGTTKNIWVYGTCHGGNSVINIKNGAVVDGGTGPGVGLNGCVTVCVEEGATVTGTSGIEVRAGSLNVSGGRITGTAATASNHAVNSGSATSGAGIAVAQHTTALPIAVHVSGGAITGASALYVVNPQNNTSTDEIVVVVDGADSIPAFSGDLVVSDTRASVAVSGGIFSVDPAAYVVAGYVAVNNTDADTKITYPYAVGKIAAGELTKQAGATDTTATYSVPVNVVDAGDNELATYEAHDVAVSVAAADIAGTKLSSVKLDAVVQAAVASAGADAASVTKVEIYVESDVAGTAEGSITYEVKPEMVVTVTKNDVATESAPIELTNADLAAGASFTFDLDVTATGVAAGGWVKVTHVSSDYPDETSLCKAKAGANGAIVVTVTTSHFSTFTATPADTSGADAALLPSVTNTIVSANCFGAVAITGSAAAPAFVAVPFGAFGASDAPIAARDVVQAASLSEDDRMYVWNGAAEGGEQRYEVYKVSGGAWVADGNKVTVASNGTVTVGSESPDSVTVRAGTGVFIERQDASKPIYVYGQVLPAPASGQVSFGSGLTLVSPPSTLALSDIDLNKLEWEGVSELDASCVKKFGAVYKAVKTTAGADYIYYRNQANDVIQLYRYDGRWGTRNNLAREDAGVIPAGTAFWFANNGGTAKVEWIAE